MAAQAMIGLDLGFSSIKAVELSNTGNILQLVSLGSIPTPPRGLLSNIAVDEQAMVNIISKLLKEMRATTKVVNTALPESSVFTRVIEVPKLTEKELAASIKWEAEQYVPLPVDQVNLDFAILDGATNNATMDVLLVAAPTKLVDKYARILEDAGLELASIETGSIAISRILPKNIPPQANVLSLNIGASAIDVSIIKGKLVSLVHSIPIGGDSFTRAIVEELGFSHDQAEEYKRTYGLDKDKLEGKIYSTIKPIFDNIITEINKILAFYKEHYPNDKISTIIISGGSAKLPGIISYLAEVTGIDTQLSNPFDNIAVDPKIKDQVFQNSSDFAVACGLALKEFIP